MKKSLLFCLLLILVMGFSSGLFAQTFEYSFSSAIGTFSPITGGTLLGTETSDDQRFVDPAVPAGGTTNTGPGFPIGFDFMFNGISFDRLAINNNGWISLGQSALTPSVNMTYSALATPLGSTSVITPGQLTSRIAALGRDLGAQVGSSLRLQTIGTSPNQICVIQWLDYKKYSNTGDSFDFQIRLYQTTNKVEIVYGDMTSNATSGNFQVGLRGEALTDFFARATSTDWNATTAAALNTDYCVMSNTIFPANGLTFSFNYPVQNTPPNPANIVSPANGATLVSLLATVNWASGGGFPTGYRINFGTNNPPNNIANNTDLGAVTSYDPPGSLNPATTFYWQVIPYNSFGNAANCPVWSFTTHGDPTITALPYSQTWDNVTVPALPFDWTSIVQSTVTTSYVKTVTTSPNTAPNALGIYNSSDTASQVIAVGPPLATNIPANTIRVKFWGKGSTTYHILVGVLSNPTDPATFTTVQDITLTSAWAQYTVDLTAYTGTGRNIAFKHANASSSQTIYIDGVSFELIAPNDLGATTITGNTTPSVFSPAVYTVGIRNWGTAGQSAYTVKLFNSSNVELASVAGPTIASGAETTVQLGFTPTVQGPMVIYGKVVLTGDINPANDITANLPITVMPAGVAVVTIGTGELAEGVPFEFYYKNSLFETLYYPTEIGMFGNVTALTFYNNFVTDLPNKPVKIWLGSTQLADLSAGWILPAQLTLVYDGVVNFPVGQNSITIPLQTPYAYSGGNLVLYANRPMDTAYFSSSDNFQAQTVGTNRALKLYSDSTEYDPAAPSAAGTLSGTFPKTSLHLTPLSPDPLFMVNPASQNFGTVLMGTTNNAPFSVMNAGGGTLNVSAITISGSPFFTLQNVGTLPAALATGQTVGFTVRYLPTAAGTHTATISITDNRMVHTVQVSGTSLDATIYTLPYAQAFDEVTAPALPVTWSKLIQSTATALVQTYTTNHTAPNSAGMTNSTDANATAILIAPPLATAIPTNTVRLKFWARSSTAGYPISIGVMTSPTDASTYTEIQNIALTATFTQYTVDLTSYTGAGKFISFKHGLGGTSRLLYVDDVQMELISPNDLAATAISGNVTPSVGTPATYTVSIFNNGTATQTAYSVKLYNAANTELATAAGTSVAAGATVQIPLSWTPAVEGATSIYGKVILAGDVNPANDATNPMSVTVQPTGVMSVTIGEGNLAEGVPFEFFYKNSLFQTLYYPTEIGMYGNITSLTFYNNFVTNLPNKPVKIWLGSTTLADLSAGWIPAAQLTQVYNGNVNFPSGQNSIVIPLQVPFSYTGGNLVLYANRPMDTVYFSSSDNFQAQTVGTTRARKLISDSTEYDPLNPSAAGTLSGTFPKTTLTMTPLSPDPLFAVNPASYDFGQVLMGMNASTPMQALNVGGGTLTINSVTISGSPFFTLEGVPTLPANLTTGQTVAFVVRYSPTAAGNHTATITITDNLGGTRTFNLGSRDGSNRTAHTVPLTGSCIDPTITSLPYAQAFDTVTAPALPLTWSKLIQSTATALVQTYTTNHTAPNSAGMTNSTDASAIAILIAPPLATNIPVNTTRIKFWSRSGSAGYPISIGVMTNPQDAATYTEIQNIPLTAAFTEYIVSFTGYTGTGRYIAFKHGLGGTSRLLYVDDFQVELVAPNDLGANSISGNSTPTVGIPSNYTVMVQNWGTAAQSTYSVKLMSGTTELASVPGPALTAGQILPVVIPWAPTTAGAATIFGKVVLTGDQNTANDQTAPMNVDVNPAGLVTITVGDGSQNARMPFDMFYKNSLYQTLYYPAEMGNFIGQITGLRLYNNFTSALTALPTKVWIGTTTLADLSAGYIPSTQLTPVFDGTIDYPSGENVITISFNAPFLYLNGENLVIMFNRPMDTQYYSSSDYFKCQTVGTNRARNIYSDSTTYDPAAPPAGTATGQFPKTTFMVIPGGVGDILGTVTGPGSVPLEGVAVALVDAGYTATTNASGQYSMMNVLPGNYNISFSKYGYVTQTQAIVLAEDQELTVNASLVPMATVNVTGTVLASDTAAGINGAAITLTGYANYSANSTATGAFTVPAVYANQTYSYVISAPGYTSATGNINVGATNHAMGNITLSEIAFAPGGVTATLNGPQTEAIITWTAPDPNALEITEGFEATTFPPTDWTQTITNTGPANTSGVYPTWCKFGTVPVAANSVVPTEGASQAGLWWSYEHQDEWLRTPGFAVPPNAYLRFDSYVYQGSTAGDHYYVKGSIDGGANWTILWDASAQTGGWNYYATPITIDLAAYSGQQLRLAWHAVDPPSNDGLWYVWFIDDIYIGNATGRISFSANDLTVSGIRSQSWTIGSPLTHPSRAVETGMRAKEAVLPSPAETYPTRSLTGYKVWRFAAGQETNPASWISLTPQLITPLTFTDTGWSGLANGNYRWAVKAVYTGGIESVGSFSNVLLKEVVTGMISGVVRQSNNQPIPGATVTAGTFTATTNNSGAYVLIVPTGTYTVTASKVNYQTATVNDVVVNANQTTTVNFTLIPGSGSDDEVIPATITALTGNYPNPFNPTTTISYSIKDPAAVQIVIYNVKGQKIRTLVNQNQTNGKYNVVWNGKDDSNQPVGSGVYYYRMSAGKYLSTRKMLLVE